MTSSHRALRQCRKVSPLWSGHSAHSPILCFVFCLRAFRVARFSHLEALVIGSRATNLDWLSVLFSLPFLRLNPSFHSLPFPHSPTHSLQAPRKTTLSPLLPLGPVWCAMDRLLAAALRSILAAQVDRQIVETIEGLKGESLSIGASVSSPLSCQLNTNDMDD